jgi:hypothetical protein
MRLVARGGCVRIQKKPRPPDECWKVMAGLFETEVRAVCLRGNTVVLCRPARAPIEESNREVRKSPGRGKTDDGKGVGISPDLCD